jgi:hypothetical protein
VKEELDLVYWQGQHTKEMDARESREREEEEQGKKRRRRTYLGA